MAQKIPMGIGRLGSADLVFKRKFRFTLELQDICGGRSVPRHYVKVAARPNLNIDEVEINFLNGVKWIPGKAKWQTISVTYIDVANLDMSPLWNWLISIYNFTDPINLEMGSQSRDYSATAVIKLWDGCGQLIETWELKDVWPTAIDFGELDYSSIEETNIELTLRYSQVKYIPECPRFELNPCCSPCSNGETSPILARADRLTL